MVSGSLIPVPLGIVTQTLPATLVWVHPFWKPTVIPPAGVVLVILYIAVNRRPVVGVGVRGAPSATVAARWKVPITSVVEHTLPMISLPSIHSRTI
jgi:hypothetical protein